MIKKKGLLAIPFNQMYEKEKKQVSRQHKKSTGNITVDNIEKARYSSYSIKKTSFP